MVSTLLALLTYSVLPRYYPTFSTWSSLYNRSYLSATERDYRESVYTQNLAKIAKHNAHNHSWSMDVNQFADLTSNEFAAQYIRGGYVAPNATTYRKRFYNWQLLYGNKTTLPTTVDWTTQGAVTPVKDQGPPSHWLGGNPLIHSIKGQCGSCWAFSATGSMESTWFLKNGSLVSLSEQQLVDCSVPQGNQGCDGGLMDDAFQYVISNKGITSESAYPYTATGPNACQATGKPVAAMVTGYKDVPSGSELALMTALTEQPVSVAVEADQNVFQFYSGGVLTASCGSNLDHGVLAVGYGTQGGQDYYKVKNSWGTSWGEKGYILLGRGSQYGANGQCGIQMDPSYTF